MNIRVIDEKEKNLTRRTTRPVVRKYRKKDSNMLLIGMIFSLIITLFVTAYMQVKFSNEIETLNRRAVILKSKMHEVDRELDNSRIDREKYNGKYIISKVKSMKLKLTFPKPGQVKKLVVSRNQQKRKSNFDGDFILSLK
jgi:hypothetical protein